MSDVFDPAWQAPPICDGLGSASTLSEYSTPQKVKRKRRIGFKFPKPKDRQ